MGLTNISSKKEFMKDIFNTDDKFKKIVCLVGNPNTGKSSIFNTLTGMHQHTGNWSGKTVVNAYGEYTHNGNEYGIIDLPGIYSILSYSQEEEVAREFICFGKYDVLVLVCDMTSLERNLNIFFQMLEINNRIIICLNLCDEAKKKNIHVDLYKMEKMLGVPIVVTSTKENIGLNKLRDKIDEVISGKYTFKVSNIKYDDEIENIVYEVLENMDKSINFLNRRWIALRLIDSDSSFFDFMYKYLSENEALYIKNFKNSFDTLKLEENREKIIEGVYKSCKDVSEKCVKESRDKHVRDRKIDDIVTSKKYGIPIMLLLLGLVLFITISLSNIPSSLLSNMFNFLESKLSILIINLGISTWIHDMVVYGLFRVTGWVISVMLPPMAIFFPIFTFLEDLGYLPRVAFNMDYLFKKSGCHGKQCLTMCMGFGCNCAGIIGTRIIESKRERLIAILTNNFVPCNGRFPTMIVLSTIFFSYTSNIFFNSIITALIVTIIILIGICVTFLVSYILSKTLLKGEPSSFTLELPPYRKPKIRTILYTSLIDRTIFVLGRAIMIAAPFGIIIWILANVFINDISIINHIINFLNPLGKLIGLDGAILSAFFLGIPANEIVMPILLMNYLSTGALIDFETSNSLSMILRDNGWTIITAINMMLFSLLHFPCSTALWTIKKETGSNKWTFLAFLIPTCIAFGACFLVNVFLNIIFKVL